MRAIMQPADFGRTYDDHAWQVYGFFAYRLRNRSDAEDLTQLTFERALRAWSRFDAGRASPGTWLLSIAHNLLVDHYRADRSQSQEPIGSDGVSPDALPSVDPDPDLGLDSDLAAALDRLQPREREIIALRYGGDLDGPAIAEVTGLSLGNVQQIVSRSLRKLRAALDAPTSASRRG
jgi:RNA polymerase sigma-70 factor (ECF subfamily)